MRKITVNKLNNNRTDFIFCCNITGGACGITGYSVDGFRSTQTINLL